MSGSLRRDGNLLRATQGDRQLREDREVGVKLHTLDPAHTQGREAPFVLPSEPSDARIGRKDRLSRAAHREIPVKVTAWIDEGIVPLVLALNALPNVETLDSCQGRQDKPAHVYFRYRGDARAVTRFIAALAALLTPHERLADYTLIARWRPGTDEPLFQLACPTEHSSALARIINEASG